MGKQEYFQTTGTINWERTALLMKNEFYNVGLEIGKKGWTLPMDLSPRETQLLTDNLQNIDEILSSYYNNEYFLQKMEKILLSSNYLRENRTLIEQVFIAYKQKLYTVCIAAIVPAFENLFANFTNEKENLNFHKFLKILDNKISDNSIVKCAVLGIY